MAQDKKSFIAYVDWGKVFEELDDAEAGRLAKHLFRYVNDENPEPPDKLTKLVFIPIMNTLKNDLKKWENYTEKQKANGLKGGRPKIKKANETQITQAFLSEPKKADIVNVNVNVNDNVNEEKEGEETPEKLNPSKNYLNRLDIDLKECFENVISNEVYLETISMNNHFSNTEITKQWLNLFFKKLQNEGVAQKSINDFKSYFARWLNIELNKKSNGNKTGKHHSGLNTEEEQREFLNAVASGIARAEYERGISV